MYPAPLRGLQQSKVYSYLTFGGDYARGGFPAPLSAIYKGVVGFKHILVYLRLGGVNLGTFAVPDAPADNNKP